MVEQNPPAQTAAQAMQQPAANQQMMAKPTNSIQSVGQSTLAGNPSPSGQPNPNTMPGTSAMPEKKSIFKKWWFWLIIVLGILILGVGAWWIFLK